MELFSFPGDISLRLDGDRHSRGEAIPDSRVHYKVYTYSAKCSICQFLFTAGRGNRMCYLLCNLRKLTNVTYSYGYGFSVTPWEGMYTTMHKRKVLIPLPAHAQMYML